MLHYTFAVVICYVPANIQDCYDLAKLQDCYDLAKLQDCFDLAKLQDCFDLAKLQDCYDLAKLQDCFARTDWNMFRDSSDGIEEFTRSVTSFISKCIDDVVPAVTKHTYPNQKPWITLQIPIPTKFMLGSPAFISDFPDFPIWGLYKG
jgi:hypothetical protein